MAENKMEQVATVNNFDKLIGKNGELAELRKEQVLAGAMHIIQQHYADKQNKMEVVAKLFGKKLGEPFTVYVPFYKCKNEAVFDVHGLSIKSYGDWDNNSNYLMWLLVGEVEIVEE